MNLSGLRAQLNRRRLAQVAILVELLAASRALTEIYRLRGSPGFTLDSAMPYVTGSLIALGFLGGSVICHFAGRERTAGILAIVMVVVLLAYKAIAMPGG